MKKTALMKERIYIRTNRIGYIPQLRMQGPIITPVPVTREDAYRMIVSGIDVYQIDPVTKNATKLDLKTVFPGEGEPEKEEAPDTSASPNVNPAPVEPVNLQGVAADAIQPDIPDIEPKNEEDSQESHDDGEPDEVVSGDEQSPADEASDEKEEAPADVVETAYDAEEEKAADEAAAPTNTTTQNNNQNQSKKKNKKK
jgi:hypothetical protein